jgi:hypothetical protein
VACFFCDYKDTSSQDPVNVVLLLVLQLSLQKQVAFSVLHKFYDRLSSSTKRLKHGRTDAAKEPELAEILQSSRRLQNNTSRSSSSLMHSTSVINPSI